MESPEHIRCYYPAEPGNNNSALDRSSWSQLECSFELKSFSIRYVSAGVEYYNLNGRPYKVRAGSYLLADAGCNGSVFIDSQSPVRGICIDLSASILAAAAAVSAHPSDPDAGRGGPSAPGWPPVPEQLHEARSTLLGSCLHQLQAYDLDTCCRDLALPALFHSIAGAVLADQGAALKDMQLSDRIKESTRKELLARLLQGKDFMDSCFIQPISIARIAAEAALSEYYFLRLFRRVFRQSPYQYLLKKRLGYAQHLLLNTQDPVAVIAARSGFGNVHSFSKAFREAFGRSPSAFRSRQHEG